MEISCVPIYIYIYIGNRILIVNILENEHDDPISNPGVDNNLIIIPPPAMGNEWSRLGFLTLV